MFVNKSMHGGYIFQQVNLSDVDAGIFPGKLVRKP